MAKKKHAPDAAPEAARFLPRYRGPSCEALQFAGDSFADPATPQFDDKTKTPNKRRSYTDSPLFKAGEAIIAAFPGFKHGRGDASPHDFIPKLFTPDHRAVNPGDYVVRHEDGTVHVYTEDAFLRHFPHAEAKPSKE